MLFSLNKDSLTLYIAQTHHVYSTSKRHGKIHVQMFKEKFLKIHKKTPVLKSLFNEVVFLCFLVDIWKFLRTI